MQMTFEYRQKIAAYLFIFILFLGGGILFGNKLLQDSSEIKNWLLFILSVGFVSLSGLMMYLKWGVKRFVILDTEGISAPLNSFSKNPIYIKYTQIKSVKIQHSFLMESVALFYDNKAMIIAKDNLPGDEAYRQILNTLHQKTGLVYKH